MSNVEFKTEKRHRFGQTVVIGKNTYQVSNTGIVSVSEEDAKNALLIGYTPTSDKPFNLDKGKEVQEAADLLKTAKAESERIINEAEEKAKKIIEEANLKAGNLIDNSLETEKEEVRKSLNEKTIADLKDYMAANKFPEEKWNKLTKKNDIIEYIISEVFPSDEE